MPVKVSVVVPVYNPGAFIEPCIDSILNQSLPSDQYEAIFVDDGSTDDTPALLDKLAAEAPNVRVIHIPNSGWPGRPRNVGIDAASGEFVQFLDHDDQLGAEALQRLYDYAVDNDADVVIGKMAGLGRAVPRELFRRNRPTATVANAPLIDSLTPHKMFRRSFLVDGGIRFPEGRRRLEDHVFVTEAFLRARNVSVLSDYVCYIHVRRSDEGNAGLREIDPVSYYGYVREALDVVDRYTEPGPVRDRLYRRWLRNEMINRVRADRMLALSDAGRRAFFGEVHKLAVERFGSGITSGLQGMQRLLAVLIKANRFDDVLALAGWESAISAMASLQSATWADGAWHVDCQSEFAVHGLPLTYRGEGAVVALDPPLSKAARADVLADGIDLTVQPDKIKADLVVRERATGAEFFVPGNVERVLLRRDGKRRLVLRTEAAIDPRVAAGGSPMPDGVWDLYVRVAGLGWSKDARVRRWHLKPIPARADGVAFDGRVSAVVTTIKLGVTIDVGDQRGWLADALFALPARSVRTTGRTLRVELPLRVPAPAEVVVRYTRAKQPQHVDVAGKVDADGVLLADMPPAVDGSAYWLIEVALDRLGDDSPRFARLGVALRNRPGRPPRVVQRPSARAEARAFRRARDRAVRVIRRVAATVQPRRAL